MFLRFSADQNPSYTLLLVRECRRRGKFRPRLGPEGSDHTDLINLAATGEGIMLDAQVLFEDAMARLRSASLAARVVARRVGLPLFELVAAWSKAHPSPAGRRSKGGSDRERPGMVRRLYASAHETEGSVR